MTDINNFTIKITKSCPRIYAYEDIAYEGCLKVGYTERDVATRVAEQYPTKRPDGKLPYKIVLDESAIRKDGSHFNDHDVHRRLEKMNLEKKKGEWFCCSKDDVMAAILALREGIENIENRTLNFSMREEQAQAVEQTIQYYKSIKADCPEKTPKFLWNAKMRFGKTFTAYKLAEKMNFKRILILTFKPAVKSAWENDLLQHLDFEGWQFISKKSNDPKDIDIQYKDANKEKPIVCFGSFQDLLGENKTTGGIKTKNEWIHTTNWDLVIFDEYHFGAWRENAKSLFEQDEETQQDLSTYDHNNALDETWLPITTSYYLFLSGTPFKALNSGEFIEEQIFSWTYSDEQNKKAEYAQKFPNEPNPYEALPQMLMFVYEIPDSIKKIAMQGEFDEFDLNTFFKAEGKGENAKFIYEEYVQKWLHFIQGSLSDTSVDYLKQGATNRAPMPFSDIRLLESLSHTVWYLPNVASCFAMSNLLKQQQNKTFFKNYTINVCAGTQAGIGAEALEPILKSMGNNPLDTKTITLSCGKLMTGVTVKEWTGIFMLSNMSSPETYFQAAFRVQSPWEIKKFEEGKITKEIIKRACYVFDFSLNRALRQISEYSCKLGIDKNNTTPEDLNNPEKQVEEFIKFLPVLAYNDSSMRKISASEILDIVTAGTSGTLLARRWESTLLVNVDNDTLLKILANKEALNALMSIEGFRNLNSDIETIVNKSEELKKARKSNDETLPKKEKKKLDETEKELKNKRKEIQEKLIKFATRIPIFMYLTDYREYSLKDVITKLEPQIFKKVTGLNIKDFDLLVSLGVFNESLMNDAVYKFKRYEEYSLTYTGLEKNENDKIGLYDTVISREDFNKLAGNSYLLQEEYNKLLNDFQKSTIATNYNIYDIPDEYDIISLEHDEEDCIEENNSTQNFNEININIGTQVIHKSFGEGTVIDISDKNMKIKVLFYANKEKFFTYPDVFKNGFLALK